MNASELELDEIGLGVDNASISLLATGSLSIEIDLDADDDGEWFENATDVELSASVESIGVSVPNVGASSSFMGLAVVETSLSDTTLDSADIVATYRNATTDVGLDLEFSLDANDDFPFEFVDVNDVIKVKGPENGEFSVNMPSLQPKQGIGNFSLEHIFDNKVDFSQIPFIHNCDYEEVKISDIVGNIQEYWARASFAINGAVENGVLNLEKIGTYFEKLVEEKQSILGSLLEHLSLDDGNGHVVNLVGDGQNVLQNVALSTSYEAPTSLYLNITPTIANMATGTDELVNLGLLKLGDLNVDCSVRIKLDVHINSATGKLCFDSFNLDRFDLLISKNNINETISLGLFSATVTNGIFSLTASYDANNGSVFTAIPEFSVESATLRSGSVTVAKLDSSEGPYGFGYDSLTENWIVPDEIKAFASLSGETLSHQVVAYLQSMQTALRKQLEDNVKLDFLGGSVGDVVDIVNKVDKVVFGSSENAEDGLLKVVEGSKYKANFSSVEEFVLIFNEAWESVFGESNACSLFLLGDNAQNPISMLVSRNPVSKELETSLPTGLPENFEFQNFRLVFSLRFTESKDFDLNLAKSLGDGFANVATYGNVSAGCSAGISFSLDVKFDYQTINDGNGEDPATTLGVILGEDNIALNETYYESTPFDKLSFNETRTDVKLDGSTANFAFTFKVDDQIVLVHSGQIDSSSFECVETVQGKENEFTSVNTTGLPEIEYNKNIKKLIIKSGTKFDISNSGSADAFSELKLINTVPQTCFSTTFDSNNSIVISLKGVGNADDVDITLDLGLIQTFATDLNDKGLLDSPDWKKCLDKYLSLQKSDENQFGLDDVLSTGALAEGRSIKNTYGLYVVDINEGTDEILFGCDPSLIKGYKTKREGNGIKIDSDYYTLESNSGFKYMRISGVLNASGAIGSQKGVLIEKYSESLGYASEYIDLSSGTTDVDALQENLDGFAAGAFVAKEIENNGVGIGLVDSRYVSYWQDFSKLASDADVSEIYRVTISDNFLAVVVGNDSVHVDTKNCSDLNDLSRAIKDSLDANTIQGVKSVVAQNNRIVFTVDENTSLSWFGYLHQLSSLGSDDFKIKGSSASIDFESLNFDENTTVQSFVTTINTQLNGTGVYLCYSETDPESHTTTYWDHFEFRSNSPFSLENVGASKILEKLGFTTMRANCCGDGDYRIVGKTLLGVDWSKLFSLDESADAKVELYAKVDFSIGKAIEVKEVDTSDQELIVISLDENANKSSFAVGGYVKFGDVYFKIHNLDVNSEGNVDSITVSKNDWIVIKENASTTVNWNDPNISLRYVAAIEATFNFVDVNLVADGSVHVEATFTANKKTDANNANDSFLSNWEFQNPQFVYTSANQQSESSNKFEFGGAVAVPGFDTFYIGENKIELEEKNGLPSIKSDFSGLETAIHDKLSDLSNFSVQDVYALLDGLVDRLTAIAKNSDIKIPVINKSVGDLVNVANDIRKIVNNLRKDNIVSLQGLNNRLIKYLNDFGLTSTQGKEIFKLKYNNELQQIGIEFNVRKAFSSVHKFNFGNGSTGISGNADLKVSGGFWFELSANMDSSFDFVLGDVIKFGADIDIVGEKLSFNLGIDAAGDSATQSEIAVLLKDLITVGSNNNDAFIFGNAALIGKFGDEGVSLTTWKKNGTAADLNPNCVIPMVVCSKLPISVCGYSLGDVLFGKWMNGGIVNAANVESAKAYKSQIEQYCSDWLSGITPVAIGEAVKVVYDSSRTSNQNDSGCSLRLKESDSANNGDFVVDFSSVYSKMEEILSGDFDWFDKIKLAVTGLNRLLDTMESSINGGMMSDLVNVPVVGGTLSSGVDFLSDLKQKILEPFSNFVYESTGMTAQMVAQKLSELLDGYLIIPGASVPSINVSSGEELWKNDISNNLLYRQGNEFAEWFFRLGGDYSFGSNIGFDLGYPGLGLEAEGGLNLSLSWSLEFGFGVSKEKGFYFIFGEGDEVSAKVSGLFEDESNVLGKMAGLGMMLELDSDDGVEINFGLNFEDGVSNYSAYESAFGTMVIADTSKKLVGVDLSQAMGVLPQFSFTANADIETKITVGVLKDVKSSDTPKFPNVSGDFVFHWTDGNITQLGFSEMKLDMGSFISGVLAPIVSKIQKVVEPLKPLIDFLTTPFPVLKDLDIIITPLSLAKEFSKGKFDDSMVYAIKDLIDLSEKIAAFGNNKSLLISLGSMPLIGGMGGNKEKSEAFLKGQTAASDFAKMLDDKKNNFLSGYENASKDASSALSGNGLQVGDGSWRFIWDKPTDIFKLLLGQDIDLVHYDMPKLSFDFDWDTFIRIWAPLGVRLGVSFNANIDLAFGYDTLGIRQWVGSDYKDFSRLLNGFYVDDLDGKGNDKNELSFYGGLKASAELNAGVSAGVGGGVGINVGFNLFDPNKDGKLRLNEIERVFKEEGLFGMFDVNGAITAKLYAYLDLLFYTKKWNITDDITLFEFNYEHHLSPVMISKSGDDVVANIGSNASSRVATNDLNKTLDDGDEILELDVNGSEVFDKYGHSEKVDGRLIINAEKGNDKIYIKLAEEDDVEAADFDIEINGGDGDDYIDLSGLQMASNRTVFIWGGAGNDTIIGADGLNIIFGDIGTVRKNDDKYIIEANVDPGVAGNDIILGGSKKDIIFGGAGDDQIDGGAGADFIFGDGGRYDETGSIPQIDRTDISLDGGNDTLIGGDGNDAIYGGGGDDHVDGGAGNDEIYGERGHDRIMGGSDDDTIHGGDGMDIVFGDRINSTPMDLAAPFAVDMSADKKTAAFSQEFIDAQFKNGTSASEDEFKIKLVDELNNPVKYAQEIKAAINDDNNDDFADYSSDLKTNGSDTIYGDDGNDLLFGDDGADNTDGGADKIYGGIGNDIIDGDGGNDTISGGIDNDLIYGGADDDIIDGGAGNDMLYGDNGVADYDSSTLTLENKLSGKSDNVDKVVFGDNLGLHGELYANAKLKPNANGGNDKITTGPGMDFVDGQGGSDKITVKLMGDSTTNYTNVTDSGLDGSDTLVVEGTESIDRLLLRQNEKQDLGFVALLPITENDFDSEISETVKKNLNSNIERVNYTQGVDVLNVNANGGDDQVYIDGTAQTTNVDGGAGADKFYVGQLYNSDRVTGTSANIQPVDEFNATKTNEESYLSDGVSSGTKLNIEGGSGADEFVALNNVGALSMSGGRGDDTFSVYSFRKEDGVTPFDRGAMTIDGGKDTDTLNVRGTDAEDVFVVTKEGMLSDLVAIKAAGVESTQFDAAAGDDMFYVVGNKSTDVTELNGGKGNDTFSMGGLDKEYTLRSANTDGQTVDVKYEFVDANGVADTSKESLTESFTVVDSDSAPAVFIVENKGTQNQPDFEIQESYEVFLSSENAAPVSFFVGCAGLQNNQTLDVTISAPVPSTVDSNRGDRGFLVGYRKNAGGGIEWGETITVHPTNNTPVEVFVKALQDDLIEEGVRKAIAISSTWNNGSAKNVLTKSVTSVGLVFAGENRDGDVVAGRPLVRTEEFIIGASNEFKVNSIYVPQPDSNEAAANQVLSFYVDGVKQNWSTSDYNLSGNVVTINPNLLQAEKTLTICVRSNVLRVDDSKVYLAYEDMDIDSITIGKKTVCEYTEGCDRYYELNGNVITFYNGITRQPMTVHDAVIVNASLPNCYDWENFEQTTPNASSLSSDLLNIFEHNSVLSESGRSDFTSTSYNVEYKGQLSDGQTVYVKITPTQLLANSEAVTESKRLVVSCSGFSSQADGSIIVSFDSENKSRSITVTAVPDNALDDYGVTKVGEKDKKINDIDGAVYAYGYGKSMMLDTGNPAMLNYKHVVEGQSGMQQASNFNELNNFDEGKLFSLQVVDGVAKIDFSSLSEEQAAVLNSVIETEWNENLSDSQILSLFYHKTFKWVNQTTKNVGTTKEPVNQIESTVADKWFRIENASYDSSSHILTLVLNEPVVLPTGGVNFALISGNRDSLFVDEMASVDRLFVNNQQDSVDARASLTGFVNNNRNEAEKNVDAYDSHAVRFTHTELEAFPEKQLAENDDPLMMQSGITAAQMEYAEYNLGKGKDTVDINKTLYREDAYRTYTVVNTGNVAEDSTAGFGAHLGDAGIAAENAANGALFNDGVYHYGLTPIANNGVNVVREESDTKVYYVEAIIKKQDVPPAEADNFVTQRREVKGSFSNQYGFDIEYDFILAEGEYIDGFRFYQAEFDDDIKVNSYQADHTGSLICSGTISSQQPELNQGVVTYSYIIDSDDSSLFVSRKDAFDSHKATADNIHKDAPNGYEFTMFVDATLSDGSVQRRAVSELTSSSFSISRDFTLTAGISIVSLKFAYGYEGDGQLVINAQSGHDRIDASSTDVTRNDMVAFGGLGDDHITMNKGGIAFGDRGQVLYDNGQVNGVDVGDTVLGSTVNNIDTENPAFIDDYTTGIGKTPGRTADEKGNPVHRLQTDGVNRDAYRIQSVDAENGGTDMIKVGGTNSVVVGGAENDVIVIGGDKNVALGDNGRVKYNNAGNDEAVYGDKLGLGMHIVETTNDSIGGVDNIVIAGDKNVAMGGAEGDSIRITGADNVAIGDGGRYTIEETRLYAESKSEQHGGQDFISTGDGKNAVIGGTANDVIRTGAGNDAIVGDGGKVIMDTDRNALMVSNEGYNVGTDLGTAGADDIDAGNGDNVVFGGLDGDDIRTGTGKDVVFGDNGFATFRGNAAEAEEQVTDTQSIPETRTEATLSFNFMGASQTGLSSEDVAGAADFAKANWNNVGGSLAGTYGNDDREIVRFDDNTRASAVSVSYGGIESHRNTSTDNRINLQAYGHNLSNASTDADAALMNSGYMTTAPGNQCDNKLEVAVDGLAQYFTDYHVAVYLDMPDANSWEGQSIRKVSLYIGSSATAYASYYVNDCAGSNFNGTYKRSEYTSAEAILADLAHNAAVLSGELTGEDAVLIDTTGNYVVFEVPAGVAADNFRVIIEDGYTLDNINGKDIPGIAAIQVKGTLHAQDVAASTDIAHGGADTVYTSGGDDIVVGGTGGDTLTTYGDERYGIYDNDVVFGDNAKMVFTDRDSSEATASTLSLAESLDSRTVAGDYNDHIYTGDGNDVVVGGQGADHIESGATAAAEAMLDGIQVASFNFTRENATASEMVGETAGVVADNDWTNLYIKNNGLHVVGENYTNAPVTHDGIGISLVAYDTAVGDGTQNSSLMPKDDAQLDGDTSNSKLFNAYYAAQQQQEIKLTLTNLDSFADGAPCDVYVYLGGDQQNTDTYNYLFDIWGHQSSGNTPDQHYYLNDWTGSHFDGDYRLVECATAPTADELLSQVAPDMRLVGNYVVFHGVSSATFEVRIRNLFTDTNQWPLNLPVITAVQVVAGTNREEDIAVGGDHDKDLVFGDDARVTFDIDAPFARNENLADYANRAIEAESMHFDGAAVEIPLDENDEPVETGDTILTGKDRDVIVGGDFGDTITMGDGDDVALGDNASLILEHNNPVGVFAPSVEIMLEQHTVTTSTPEVFLGNNDTDAGDIQDKFENGGVPGVTPETSANGDTDFYADVTNKDWVLQQEATPGKISRIVDVSSAQVITFAEGETMLLVSDTWPGKDNPWWNPNIVLISDGQGHSVPALAWEWDVNGTTMTASTQSGYYFAVDIPDTPNGDNRYEIRVTALTAGTAVISIG
ncbi:calcium-binding protein [Fibrobacter sp. UWOV1]|uniref:calcium-binding protein n=1 Tax=Fibrobacter sp. UWOV1 TaxID=1896215 RepID=UPI001114DDC3|nr:calcium-binding protein [Fibrobacter sp. UWOV1]